MKNLTKKGLSLLLVLLMVFSLLPQISLVSSAATVNYVKNGNYVYNWGSRGTTATFMSPMAEDFYEKYNVTLASLSAYSGASSTSSVPASSLYSKLKTLMTNAHSYKTSYDATKDLYQYTDCQNSGGKISSFYSGTSIGPGWGEGGSWNREHTWPNSKGLGGQDENDIMMLRPTSTSENSSRGNTAYGKSASYYDPNGESSGRYNLHGDVARIMLYTYVRWGNTSKMWGASGVMESKDVLLEWMEEDPVDTWELGRNDAVQSITGTRNVFVDFPELAFELFEADIPSGYQSPSGGTPSYTIIATPNNASYGTVSMSGKTITAYPYTGYQVSGYKVTSGTATVTQSGNTFTVVASSDCSIQIIFTARTQATLTFIDRDQTVSTKTAYGGDVITIPAYTGTAPANYAFRGWVTMQVSNTETKPAVIVEGTNYTVSGSTTFYALYAKIAEGTTGETSYVLATDVSQLSEGASVVIAASGTTQIAMKSSGGTNNRYAGTIVKNDDNTISFQETALIDILTLGAGESSGTYSFYSEANGQYLAAGTSDSNILKLQDSVDACASFAITISSDGTATAISQTSGARNSLRYNSSANVFACYATGQKAISFYVRSGSSDQYYTTNPTTCQHSNTTQVAAVAPTCTQSGLTAGVYCNDCGNYISGRETVDALGHSFGAWVETTAPGCTTPGVKTQTCAACGEVQTQSVAAIGHNYVLNGLVYTCENCGDSYDTYYITFSVPEGVDSVAAIEYTEGGIKLPAAKVPSGDGVVYTFIGWSETPVEDTDVMPEVFKEGETYLADGATKLYAVYAYSVAGGESSEYVLTDITQIQATDTVVITMTTSTGVTYAMSNNNSTASAPTAVEVTVSGEKLAEEPVDILKWNITGSNGTYTIYPDGDDSVSLYCTSANNGVRVGTNSNNAFIIDSGSGYLKNTGTNRYVGVYTGNPDWRCYTSTSVNIGNQVLGFYVQGEGSTPYYTTLGGNSCDHSETYTVETAPTCTEAGIITYYCALCDEWLREESVAALDHDYQPIVTSPTCTEQGYSTYTCTRCGEVDEVSDYADALGHNYVDGKCDVCGEADPDYVACEHEYEAEITYATTTAGGYTTYTCSKCGDSYQDNFTNKLPMNLRFASVYLSLESDLSVIFQMKPEVLAAYDDVRLVFTLGEGEHVLEMTEEDSFVGQTNRPSFKFTGVAPRHVHTNIYATLYGTIEGVEHTYTLTYAASKYCYSTLRKDTTSAALKTLIVDLLHYGAAHQIYGNTYVDNLATADLTDAEKALGTSTIPDMTSYMSVKYVTHESPTARFNNAALYLEDAVTIRCKLTLNDGVDINNVTVKVTDDDGNEWIVLGEELTHDSGNVYYLNFKSLSAQQMRKIVYITICENGAAISHTLRYSIESYAATGYPTAAGTALGDVILAMIRYGDSAKAYFENK